MKSILRKNKIVSLCVSLLIIIVGMVIYPSSKVSAEGTEYTLEGIILDTNWDPIINLEIIITNLETEEEVTVYTDIDGAYALDLNEVGGFPPAAIEVTLADENFEGIIKINIIDEISLYCGDAIAKSLSGLDFPDPSDTVNITKLTVTPCLGLVEISRTDTGGYNNKYDQSNFDPIGRTQFGGPRVPQSQRYRCLPNSDCRWYDSRTNSDVEIRERWCFETTQLSVSKTQSAQGFWMNVTSTPYDTGVENVNADWFLINGIKGIYYQFHTQAGYIVEKFWTPGDDPTNWKWIDDGSGWAGNNHWVFYTL